MSQPPKDYYALCLELEQARATIEALTAQNARLRALVVGAWLEAWRDGNQFAPLPPETIELSSYRAWTTSETLKQMKALEELR